MKKNLLFIYSLLVCLLFAHVSKAQTTSSSTCVKSNECFEFTYKGATTNSNGTVTLRFGIKTNCGNALSYAAFGLPAGTKASNALATTYNYTVENGTNQPFYAVKFEAKNADAYKNGKTDEFSYTIPASKFATMSTIKVQAKAATTTGSVEFNTAGCNVVTTPPTTPTNPTTPTTPTTPGGNNGVCVEIDKCFQFEYLGYVVNANGTVTLTFKAITNCGNALSNIAFQLPNGAQATNPTNSNKDFKYTTENGTNNPFYSLKFEASPAEGYKDGASDTFSYTLTTAQFALLTSIKVQAKAAGTIGTVTFNAKGCAPAPVCPTPTATIAGPDSVCAFQDAPVTYMVNTSNTSGTVEYAWTVPADWTIVSETGNTIKVQVGSESGQVGVTVTNECGTSATDMQDVFVREECGELTPLPVTLISFEGEATKSGVLLEWATASEVNNEKFEIERSADGSTFTKVGEVKGNGTTNVKRTYSMRDAKAGKGLHYYRLRQVDFDGKFEHSKVIAIENNQVVSVATLSVAPNPVTDGQFAIMVDGSQAAQLQITDMNGRLIHSQTLSQGTREVTLNAGSLNMKAGLYIINVKAGNAVNHAKIVVR